MPACTTRDHSAAGSSACCPPRDDGERQQELEQGEAALITSHFGAPGGGVLAVVRRLTISTPRLSPQLTFTSIR